MASGKNQLVSTSTGIMYAFLTGQGGANPQNDNIIFRLNSDGSIAAQQAVGFSGTNIGIAEGSKMVVIVSNTGNGAGVSFGDDALAGTSSGFVSFSTTPTYISDLATTLNNGCVAQPKDNLVTGFPVGVGTVTGHSVAVTNPVAVAGVVFGTEERCVVYSATGKVTQFVLPAMTPVGTPITVAGGASDHFQMIVFQSGGLQGDAGLLDEESGHVAVLNLSLGTVVSQNTVSLGTGQIAAALFADDANSALTVARTDVATGVAHFVRASGAATPVTLGSSTTKFPVGVLRNNATGRIVVFDNGAVSTFANQ